MIKLTDILKEEFDSRYVLVANCPQGIKNVLDEVGYHRKDIKVESSSTYSPQAQSGEGKKAFTAAVDLASGNYKITWGSWGGGNPFEPKQVDLDTSVYPIPYNAAIVQGSIGGTSPVYAYVKVHPDNFQKLLPSGQEDMDYSEQEKKALKIIKTYKAGSRKEGFYREELGPYSTENPIVQKFIKNGLIKVTGTGIQITLDGKNLADSFKGIIV
jgi:hypothetical protein